MAALVTAFIGIGSNLDHPSRQVLTAFEALAKLPQSELRTRSSLYRSKPLGPRDQPDYINAVAELSTRLSPHRLLDELQRIEHSHHRVRTEHWGARTLDLDILLYGAQIIDDPRLRVPHPRLAERAFVVIPLAEIAPEFAMPGLLSPSVLRARVKQGIKRGSPSDLELVYTPPLAETSPTPMETVYSLEALRVTIQRWRREGARVALVPTMGNLHAGHISLLERACTLADRTVVSIFVNPIQFGKGEDYAKYPSTLDADREKLAAAGLDLLFAPNLDQLYPGGIEEDTRVTVPGLSTVLCGQYRPGHFSGVATVVTKLFINIQPDIALFGEKDYQQVLIIKRMSHDLLMPVEIVGMPIVREADGLAMSSRNNYLNPEERRRAPQIYIALCSAAAKLKTQSHSLIAIETAAMAELAATGFRPEYFSIRRTEDLSGPQPEDTQLQILVAAWLGNARLIDNLRVALDRPLTRL